MDALIVLLVALALLERGRRARRRERLLERPLVLFASPEVRHDA